MWCSTNAAVALTAYCYLHITLSKDQKLFHPCTAKFSDNSQCRVPVLDITHDLPLCREHAWKRDNYNRISQEQKPKKVTKPQPLQSLLQTEQALMTTHIQSQPQPKQQQKKLPKSHTKTKQQIQLQHEPTQQIQEQMTNWPVMSKRPITDQMGEPMPKAAMVKIKNCVTKAPRQTHKYQQPAPYPQQPPLIQSQIHPQTHPVYLQNHPQIQNQPQPQIQSHHLLSQLQPELQTKSQTQSKVHTQTPAKAKSTKQASRPAKRSRAKRAYNSLSSPSSSSLSSLSSSEMHVPAVKRPHDTIDSIGSIMATIDHNNDTNDIQPNKMAKIRTNASPTVHPNPSFDGLNSAIIRSTSQTKKSRTIVGGPIGPVAPVVASPVDTVNMNQYNQTAPVATPLLPTASTLKKPKLNRPPTGGLNNVNMTNPPISGIGIGGNIAIGPSSYIYGAANNGHIDMHDTDAIEMSLGDTRLLEEHDLNNVLNQFPDDAFNEFFEVQQSDHYESTQMEQDELARALEEVDQQVKSLEQCVSIHGTGATHFLDSFLNVDGEILVETSDICEEVLSST